VLDEYRTSLGFNNPVDYFTSIGNNRDFLYGSYGNTAPNYDQDKMNVESQNYSAEFDPWANGDIMGGFANRTPIPNLGLYMGHDYLVGTDFDSPTAQRASQEAQQILKHFYPNVSQSELDQAAYRALQSGVRYYNGLNGPTVSDNSQFYYGGGPMSAVIGVMKELGTPNPALEQFINKNYAQSRQTYAGLRDQAHAADDANSQANFMSDFGGLASVFGPAIGGMMGFGPFGGAQAGASAGTTVGGSSMFEGLGNWFSNLFTDGGAAAEGLSDSFWSDWMAGSAGDLGSGVSGATDWLGSGLQSGGGITGISPTTAISGITGDIPGLGTLTEGGMLIPAAGGAAVPISSLGSGFLSSLYQQAVNDPLGTAAKAYRALQSTGALSGGLQAIGGYLAGNAAQDAAKTSAQAQIEAARIAADAAKFKPVGVTTRFGQSQFTKDAQGNVVSAGYSMPADIRAMQDSLLGAAPGMLSQFTGSQAATAPMGVGAQRAMSLGNQYLNTDPMAQAQKYYDDQQAIMATGRARDQAGALTDEFNRGTYGLATGATGMMGAANPRLEAMYNAQRQQDLQASANATQGGMDYAKFGAGLVGTGGNLLRDMYGTQSAAYSPFGTALTGAQNIEGLGQNALDLSVNMGKVASPAQSGQLLGQGMLGAAQTMQQANQYSPWGTALMNAGNALGSMQQPQQQQQYAFNPFTGVRL
jgi:hypothetical protein